MQTKQRSGQVRRQTHRQRCSRNCRIERRFSAHVHISRLRFVAGDREPPIWRRIELSSRTTLKQFHRILQIAMGWSDYHVHEFAVNGLRFGGIPDPEFGEPGEVIAEGRVRVEEVLPVRRARIVYIYDLGDYWQHSIQLESIHSPEPGATYPRVLAGGRSCPPEDCGGTGGYADLLEILLDPRHEEFEDMRDWAGEFNAEGLLCGRR